MDSLFFSHGRNVYSLNFWQKYVWQNNFLHIHNYFKQEIHPDGLWRTLIVGWNKIAFAEFFFLMLVVFNVQSTTSLRSLRDGAHIYCPLQRTWILLFTPSPPGIERRVIAWQSIWGRHKIMLCIWHLIHWDASFSFIFHKALHHYEKIYKLYITMILTLFPYKYIHISDIFWYTIFPRLFALLPYIPPPSLNRRGFSFTKVQPSLYFMFNFNPFYLSPSLSTNIFTSLKGGKYENISCVTLNYVHVWHMKCFHICKSNGIK